DERLGYIRLPEFIASLAAHRFGVDSQVRWSPSLSRFVHLGALPIYREKDHIGLRVSDRNGEQLYSIKLPERTYPDFASIPPLVVRSLLFIEDRYLFDREYPERNPAVEWNRFALAASGRIGGLFIPGLREG